jgi:Protein of unknown function (DUF2950)
MFGMSLLRKSKMPAFVAVFLLAMMLSSCKQRETKAAEKSAESAKSGSTSGNVSQKTFASPEAAGTALFDAARTKDRDTLITIFGTDGKDILFSGDAVRDNDVRERFVAMYGQMHRWDKNKAGQEILYIGSDNLAFPVPLEKNASGQWSFNSAAGKDEVLARRIGNDELTAMGVLSEIANAQQAYFQQHHQYAAKIISDEGQQNGLFWPVAEGQKPSPLGRLANVAKDLGYTASNKQQPFIGYYYKVLTLQGDAAKGDTGNGKVTGFAIVAWPAKYKDSGIMSFLVGKNGVIYQKDLGDKTAELAPAINDYSPDETWTVVLTPESPNFPARARTAKK